jgi:uncharacterized membrane protein
MLVWLHRQIHNLAESFLFLAATSLLIVIFSYLYPPGDQVLTDLVDIVKGNSEIIKFLTVLAGLLIFFNVLEFILHLMTGRGNNNI